MKQQKYPVLSEETKTRIIERWRHSKLNQVAVIAIEFNCHHSQVNAIINKYLSSKIRP